MNYYLSILRSIPLHVSSSSKTRVMGNSTSAPVPLEKPAVENDAAPSVIVVPNYKPTPPEIPPIARVEAPSAEVKVSVPEVKSEVEVPAPTPAPASEPAPKSESAPVPEPTPAPKLAPAPEPESKTAKGWFSGWFTSSAPKPVAELTTTPVPEAPVPEAHVEPAIPAAAAPAPVENLNENVRRTCARCNQDFEVPASNANNKLCGRQQCFNRLDAHRKCRYCEAEFVSLGANDHRVHCNAVKCANHHARRHIYRQTSKYSVKAIAWLNSIAKREGIVIYHAQNKGEFAVDYQQGGGKRFYYVDGFCEATNTIYEFYGDYYHGNPNKYKATDFNKDAKKTFGQLYADTQRREAVLRSRFTVITIWEDEYDTQFLTEAMERK